MSAPPAPPTTSLQKTAAQVAALLVAGTAGSFDIYFDPGGSPDAAGYANADLLAALVPTVVPVLGSTSKSVANLKTLLSADNPTGSVWAYYHTGAPSGTGFALTDLLDTLTPDLGDDIKQAITIRPAIVYSDSTWAAVTPNHLDPHTILVVKKVKVISGTNGTFYQIVGGTYDGDFIECNDLLDLIPR